jgi:hypothetical protein
MTTVTGINEIQMAFPQSAVDRNSSVHPARWTQVSSILNHSTFFPETVL